MMRLYIPNPFIHGAILMLLFTGFTKDAIRLMRWNGARIIAKGERQSRRWRKQNIRRWRRERGKR